MNLFCINPYGTPAETFIIPLSVFCFQVNMSTAARRRLMRDFRRLQEDPPMGVSGAPGENNIMIWNAVIFGI